MNYIAFAFFKDFARPVIGAFWDTLHQETGSSHFFIMYVLFAALSILGPMLRLAAWIHKPRLLQLRKLTYPLASLILKSCLLYIRRRFG